jgi:hypothetical protein
MAAENFFARWAKPKSVADQAAAPAAVPSHDALLLPESAMAPALPPALPTMDDVASLTRDSDYAPFMARGVDQVVQRGAMKKLFSDPHFNLMDGLDIYIGDYNKADPIPAAMLALLEHAKGVLDPLSMFEKPVMQLVSPPQPDAVPDPESMPDPALDAPPELDAPAVPVDAVPSVPPLVELADPSAQPLLDLSLPGVPDAAIDATPDAASDASPENPLPDTDEHTIQSL